MFIDSSHIPLQFHQQCCVYETLSSHNILLQSFSFYYSCHRVNSMKVDNKYDSLLGCLFGTLYFG